MRSELLILNVAGSARAMQNAVDHAVDSNEAVKAKNIEKIHKIISKDRKVKLSAIDTLNISTECVHHVVYEHLGMHQRPVLRTKTNRTYKIGIQMLENRWNQCIALEGNYIDE